MPANFSHGEAARIAADIVKAGVSGGTIKLNGPAATEKHSLDAADFDAKYLAKLINDLADKIEGK